ncbi:MAG: 6-phospho-beta-glucosidase [Coriobacteriaceae bacterium]|nr:MAG: 6-phospho-beta-glucosidase [Coriobacteriaceae bacterium]
MPCHERPGGRLALVQPPPRAVPDHRRHVARCLPELCLRGVGSHRADVRMEPEDAELMYQGTLDFVSFSYYRSTVVSAKDPDWHLLGGTPNPLCVEKTPWGWAVDPLGLYYCLNELYDRYQKPLFVAENGIDAIDQVSDDGVVHDDYRCDYPAKHLHVIRDAICLDHVPCIGYTMWGNVDLVSRSTGEMVKRYGFVCADMDNKGDGILKRSRKDSF